MSRRRGRTRLVARNKTIQVIHVTPFMLRVHTYAQRFALWYLFVHRGYSIHDTIYNEADRAVLGILRWSMNPGGAHVGHYIRACVRWT